MEELFNQIARCVEFGKINKSAAYPPDMKGEDGADELMLRALNEGVAPNRLLSESLIPGMQRVGEKFEQNIIYVPQLLMAAKAMRAAMEHLRPHFESGSVKKKGIFIIGTVGGDLHDIGKNLVAMMIEGNGFEVIDLGVDVKTEKFLSEIEKYPDSVLGLSALLTTTMQNMEKTVKTVKEKYPDQIICIGGAPVSDVFRKKINADFYSPDPQGAVEFLNSVLS